MWEMHLHTSQVLPGNPHEVYAGVASEAEVMAAARRGQAGPDSTNVADQGKYG